MAAELGIDVTAIDDLREGTLISDAIVTCTSSRTPFLGVEDVRPGTFVAAVGADNPQKSEIKPELMAKAAVIVDVLQRRLEQQSELRPQPIGNSAGDLGRRLIGHRKHRTDVDLAKHVAVGSVGAGRAEHEVRVPDHRQVPPRNVQQGDQLRRPLVFHEPAQALEARVGVGSVEPPSGLGARGRRVDQCLHLVVAKAGAAIM
jgi:hypothetical protein